MSTDRDAAWVAAKPNEYVAPVVADDAKEAMAAILEQQRADGSLYGRLGFFDDDGAEGAVVPPTLPSAVAAPVPAAPPPVEPGPVPENSNPGKDALLASALSEQTSFELGHMDTIAPSAPGLVEKFLVPSFTILDTRQDYWQKRRRAWLSLGMRGETQAGQSYTPQRGGAGKQATGDGNAATLKADSDGRKQLLTYSNQQRCNPAFYEAKEAKERELGAKLTTAEFGEYAEASVGLGNSQSMQTGTSVFDPVLCEIAYRWFSGPGARIIDPFAGGVVRGLVAGALGREYVGTELRPEQVADNREQAARLFGPAGGVAWGREPVAPRWVEHDATQIGALGLTCADLIFTCPPYADLEVYSNDPRDLSNMPYPKFMDLLGAVMKQTAALLKPNRFAVWVVGEARAKGGEEYGFVADTVKAGQAAGLTLYNSAILINSVGSAALRAQNTFRNRKLTRVHQHVLVFLKGSAKEAARACGNAELDL